ncbi:hypothetical protein N7486_006356 [Penicillium sp. IBT 16267x]|nr:hypothetical protein N7486_006356 [Penicillium sp. IBT 16267x]
MYGSNSRRPNRASIYNPSDATESSQSDESSPRSISDDLRGLSLAEHISAQLILSPWVSPRNYRRDSILGDLQRDLDTLVRQTLELTYAIPAHHCDIGLRNALASKCWASWNYYEPKRTSSRSVASGEWFWSKSRKDVVGACDPMSRLNFEKVDTVEHNVKVFPVGRITEGCLDILIALHQG